MKPLIIYYSFSGNNKYLAEKLHERLQCDMMEINETMQTKGITSAGSSHLQYLSDMSHSQNTTDIDIIYRIRLEEFNGRSQN